jgi:hypothetical protein
MSHHRSRTRAFSIGGVRGTQCSGHSQSCPGVPARDTSEEASSKHLPKHPSESCAEDPLSGAPLWSEVHQRNSEGHHLQPPSWPRTRSVPSTRSSQARGAARPAMVALSDRAPNRNEPRDGVAIAPSTHFVVRSSAAPACGLPHWRVPVELPLAATTNQLRDTVSNGRGCCIGVRVIELL